MVFISLLVVELKPASINNPIDDLNRRQKFLFSVYCNVTPPICLKPVILHHPDPFNGKFFEQPVSVSKYGPGLALQV